MFVYECYVYTYFTTHENSACVRIEIIILPAILYNIYILLYIIKYEFTEHLDNIPSVMVFSLRPVMLLLLHIHRTASYVIKMLKSMEKKIIRFVFLYIDKTIRVRSIPK